MSKTKIVVAGIGGIGGYFGGLLAKAHHSSDQIDIYFLARGENLNKIQQSGLKISDNDIESIVKPNLVSNHPSDFGMVDYILICTKTYDLEDCIKQLIPCINDNTVIVPLQNGVDSQSKISKLLPNNLITKGCVYLVSRLAEPGLIVKKGVINLLYFGTDSANNPRLQFLQNCFQSANIKSELSNEISKITWEKFIFLSSIATATTYFDSEIGNILVDNEKLGELKNLICEVTDVAISKSIAIDKNQVEQVIKKLKTLPVDATSSLHSDFRNGKNKTELESLTGYVIEEGQKNKVNVGTFVKMYNVIKNVT